MQLSVAVLAIAAIAFSASASAADTGRQILSLNQGWRFFRVDNIQNDPGEPTVIHDQTWETVALPHTVRLEPINASGGRNFQGVCWYRRHFALQADWKGKTLYLRFEGAMQVADVWLNDRKFTTHYGGYQPFTIDISSAVRYDDENILTVRLDNSDNKDVPPGKPQNQLDFTYFGGLYRDVDLYVLDPLHVSDEILADKPAGGGIFVSYPAVSADSATVQVQADVRNDSAGPKHATVLQELHDADGAVIAHASGGIDVPPNSSVPITQQFQVPHPKLWHPTHPDLYTLHTIVRDGDRLADTVDTRIGIRTFRFDAAKGLLINGERFIALGANRHQDHPYVGYAVSASNQWRDAKKLRDAGFSSFRSHYPQDRAFLDACDEMGMLVIESNPGWQFTGNQLFDERVYQNAREMIRRDRNRPSVVLWEAQLNESNNRALYPTLQKIVHEEYPFDPCYSSGDSVRGRNGNGANWDVVYGHVPGNNKPFWIREWGDSVDNWTDQQSPVRVERAWGELPMLTQVMSHAQALAKILAADHDSPSPLCGTGLWAGIDAYRGYHPQPFLGAPMDLFRIPKFDYYFFQSQRPAAAQGPGSGPMVFIANYASFLSPAVVTVFSNCEEVHLYRNGQEVTPEKSPVDLSALPHPPQFFPVGQTSATQSTMFMTGVASGGVHIGELKAEGLIGGKVVATQVVRAPGKPNKIVLEADLDGRDLIADGSDWVRVYARVCDPRGTTHPFADDLVRFTVSGEGELIGDARIANNPAPAQAGIATALIRASSRPGAITVRAEAFGLQSDEITIQSKPPSRQFLP